MAIKSSILAWRIPWTERSLAGYSPRGLKESDATEVLTLSFSKYSDKLQFHWFSL